MAYHQQRNEGFMSQDAAPVPYEAGNYFLKGYRGSREVSSALGGGTRISGLGLTSMHRLLSCDGKSAAELAPTICP